MSIQLFTDPFGYSVNDIHQLIKKKLVNAVLNPNKKQIKQSKVFTLKNNKQLLNQIQCFDPINY